MRKLVFAAIAAALVFAAISGCGDLVPGIDDGRSRLVTVTVARLNPALFRSRPSWESDARAFAWADAVLLTVYAKGGGEDLYVDSVTIPVGSMSTATVTESFTLTPGTYRIVAQIYNNKESGTVPVVWGETVFVLPGGTTAFPVQVVCVPSNPLDYPLLDEWGGPLCLSTAWYVSFGTGGEIIVGTDTGGNTGYGNEGWNKFTAISAHSRVQVRPVQSFGNDSVAAPYVALFDSAGEFLGESIPSRSQRGWEVGVEADTVPGQVYYFCVLDLRGDAPDNSDDPNFIQYVSGIRSHSPVVTDVSITDWPGDGYITTSPLPITVNTADSSGDQTECFVLLVSRDFVGTPKLIPLELLGQDGPNAAFGGAVDFSGITDPNEVGYILQVLAADTDAEFGLGGAWEVPFTISYSSIQVNIH